jgi:hypothetical protein
MLNVTVVYNGSRLHWPVDLLPNYIFKRVFYERWKTSFEFITDIYPHTFFTFFVVVTYLWLSSAV